jgi:hypothetical protein
VKKITYQREGEVNCEIITDNEHFESNYSLAESEAVGEIAVEDIPDVVE